MDSGSDRRGVETLSQQQIDEYVMTVVLMRAML